MATNDTTSQPEKKSKASVPADDVVDEVLRLLPSRSLARFRCVCRDWNDLISSDAFRERHLQLQVEKPRTPLKLVHAPLARWHCDSAGEPCRHCPRIFGGRPCRGLVLFRRPCALTYSVCNPSTGGVLHLPPFQLGWSTATSSARIGFHAPTGQYKVAFVGLTMRFTRRKECRVLTVGDPAGWRPASSGNGKPLCSTTQDLISSVDGADPVFANGRLHWTLSPTSLYNKPPRAQGVLSFTLGDESFSMVPSPPFALPDVAECSRNRPYSCHIRPHWSREYRRELYSPAGTALAELDGRLCMMRDVRLRRDGDVGAATHSP